MSAAGRSGGNLAALLSRWLCALALLLGAAGPAAAGHFSWDQGHDPFFFLRPGDPGPDDRPECDPCHPGSNRSPVYAATGQTLWAESDIVLRGRPHLGLTRTFNSNDPVVGLFGNGWTVDFDMALYPANSGGQVQRILKTPGGKRIAYQRLPSGSYQAPASHFEVITEGPSSVTMTMLDGSRNVFALDGRLIEQVDSNNNRIAYAYDSAGRPLTIADDNGRSLTITYNSAGFVDSVRDHGNRIWRYAYDSVGNLIAVTDPSGAPRTYRYQAYRPAADAQVYQQLLSSTDATGVVDVQFTYTGGQVASYTEGANRYTYSRSGGSTPLAGTVTRTDSAGAATRFTYGAQGLVTQDVDGLGFATVYAYDANGRLTQVTDALGRGWSYSYDTLGRIVSMTNPLGETSSVLYSGNDPRPRRLTSPSGRVTNFTYDARGNTRTATDPGGAVTTMTYTARGDLATVRNALGQTTSFTSSAIGLPLTVTDPLGRTVTFQYDGLGRPVRITNAAGETTDYAYDALDRVTRITDALGHATVYGYDVAGRLASVTDPSGSTTQLRYDTFGRRTAEVAPDGRTTTYAYRSDNLLDRITWPDGASIVYAYDANKRVTRETAGTEVINYTYNAMNQLLTATGPGGAVSYTYDAAGRIATETSDGRTHTIVRNAEGERIQLQALGQTTSYERDARGQVRRIVGEAGTFDFGLDALGRRTSLQYPNGGSTSYGYDAGGRMTSLVHAGIFNASYGYGYDGAGHVTQLTGDGAPWNFGYDAAGRLASATQGAQAFDVALDAAGNRLGQGRTYDVNQRLTGDAAQTYAYDQRGNLTLEQDRVTGARVAYIWNAKNQLRQLDFYPNATATTPTRRLLFTYDPLGRRATKSDAGVLQRYVYDGMDLIGIADAGGNLLVRSMFSGGIDEPLAAVAGGATQFFHANHLGSIAAVVEGGVVSAQYRYGPYGETLAGSSPDGPTPFRYTGREKDTEQLSHYRMRYYHAGMGRFVSPDPIGLAGGTNVYAYALGDPLFYIDPFGLFGWRDAAGFVPVLGSGLDAYDSFRCGNIGMGLFHTALALTDLTGAGALVKGFTVGTMKWAARHEIREIYRSSATWNQMRSRLQDAGHVARNSMSTPRADWMTTDHVLIKQRFDLPHRYTNHPANLQTNVPQSLNSQFEHMSPIERARHLPGWMKLGGAGLASWGTGMAVPGCDCND